MNPSLVRLTVSFLLNRITFHQAQHAAAGQITAVMTRYGFFTALLTTLRIDLADLNGSFLPEEVYIRILRIMQFFVVTQEPTNPNLALRYSLFELFSATLAPASIEKMVVDAMALVALCHPDEYTSFHEVTLQALRPHTTEE